MHGEEADASWSVRHHVGKRRRGDLANALRRYYTETASKEVYARRKYKMQGRSAPILWDAFSNYENL